MSAPRIPGRDLSLERLGDRDGITSAPLGETAHVGAASQESSTWDLTAAYQALIDAVFTGPGAVEWLIGLRMKVAALIASKNTPPDEAPHEPVARDAIRAADPWRERA